MVAYEILILPFGLQSMCICVCNHTATVRKLCG